MRSRYTAFCIHDKSYLIKTHHPSRRLVDDSIKIEETFHAMKWMGLKIIKAWGDEKDPRVGFVEFVAFYEKNPPGYGQMHELSRFLNENGKWFYLGGKMLQPLKISRNELCWCGSGKKYKRCHDI